MLNLATNALKFTDHGHVRLSVSQQSQTESTVTLRFEVEDTGIGISPEQQPRLFSAFEQADGSMTRRFGGTGLGLAIVKHIMLAHKGDVSVESAPGKGSVFTLHLPVA